MFTPADKKFLKENFATKDDLKVALKDQKEQILDAVDGKLMKQKKEILSEVDGKFVKQTETIVNAVGEYIADTIVPLFDRHEKHIARIDKKLGLPLLAD